VRGTRLRIADLRLRPAYISLADSSPDPVLGAILGDDHGPMLAPLTMTTCWPLVDASSATPP
jgi:hypothetical protein